jgi:hypothetical protein
VSTGKEQERRETKEMQKGEREKKRHSQIGSYRHIVRIMQNISKGTHGEFHPAAYG